MPEIRETYEWKSYEKFIFRIAFVFLVGICIPTNWHWYEHLFSIDWTNLHFRDLYHIARFEPGYTKIPYDLRWGIGGFINWGWLFLFSIAAGIVWTFIDTKATNYTKLWYWLEVVVRYRAAIGLIGFCWEKVFPMQMPYPSISMLNNHLGDYTPYKIYWLSIGVVPWYQVFSGLLELTAGIFLLFRKTVVWGAALMIGALLTVAVVNLGYGNASHVYSLFFVVAGVFLLFPYGKNVYQLLILEKKVIPYHYYPSFSTKWKKYTRDVLKGGAFLIFIIVFSYLTFINFLYDPYKQPSTPGVKELIGYYNVTEFKLNGKIIPYSPDDSIRWKEAIFEKWPSFALKVNRPIQVDLTNGGGYDSDHSMRNIGRAFELSGAAGGRKIFHYYVDTVKQILYLLDKNIPARNARSASEKFPRDTIYPDNWISQEAWTNIADERTAIHSLAGSTLRDRSFRNYGKEDVERQKMILHYGVSNDGRRIVLSGTDEYRNEIYIVLDRVDRRYALSESSIEAGSY